VVDVAPDEHAQIELLKVRSLCEKAAIDISESNADVGVLSILKTINDAVFGLVNLYGNKKQPAPRTESSMVNLGAIPKKARVSGAVPSSQPGITLAPAPAKKPAPKPVQVTQTEPEPDVDPEMRAFRDAVKHAEKSTLVFNLNMGSVPIMNTDTMSKRATLALTRMAAVQEGRTADNPSKDTVALIDDILSVSSGISFFGATTKSYKNPKDKDSGSYCTVPVKYEFEDKDTRVRVEQLLRAQCKVNCTTPYPTILRECIKKVIADARAEFPDNLVKVIVDTNNFCLKVARRAGEEEENGKTWHYASETIPIPREALDIRSKKIPENLTVTKVKFSPRKLRASPIEIDENLSQSDTSGGINNP
jgi:hypothetical protein